MCFFLGLLRSIDCWNIHGLYKVYKSFKHINMIFERMYRSMLFKYDPAAWSSSTLLVQAGISKSMVPAGRQQIVMYISTRCWNPMYMHEVCTQSRLNIKTNQHFFWTFLNNAILMCMHISVIDDAWASLWRFRHTVQSHAGGGKACLHDVVPRHRQNRRRIHLRVLSAKLRTQTETSETWCWYLDWEIPNTIQIYLDLEGTPESWVLHVQRTWLQSPDFSLDPDTLLVGTVFALAFRGSMTSTKAMWYSLDGSIISDPSYTKYRIIECYAIYSIPNQMP